MGTKLCPRCREPVEQRTVGGGHVPGAGSRWFHVTKPSSPCSVEGAALLTAHAVVGAELLTPPAPRVDWQEVALVHAAEIKALRAQNQHLLDRNNDLVAERRAGIRARVREFMVVAEQPLPEKPELPPEAILRLRANIFVEEFCECVVALFGKDAYVGGSAANLASTIDRLEFLTKHLPFNVDFIELVDGLGDLDYVVEGFRDACGVDGGPFLELIHTANLTKRGGPVRPDGKIGKPPGWKPPDIAAELRRQGWKG